MLIILMGLSGLKGAFYQEMLILFDEKLLILTLVFSFFGNDCILGCFIGISCEFFLFLPEKNYVRPTGSTKFWVVRQF